MKEIAVVYITCKNDSEAEKIGSFLLKKKLAACVNIFSHMRSLSLWPPKSGEVEKADESVLLVKTLKDKVTDLEKEVLKIHSYESPAIIFFAATATDEYADWIKGEVA